MSATDELEYNPLQDLWRRVELLEDTVKELNCKLSDLEGKQHHWKRLPIAKG